jgi:hypothetical protein
VNEHGTPQYILTYDHRNQSVMGPALLGATLGTEGSTNNGIDDHNEPAM